MADESHDNSGTPETEGVKQFTQEDLNKIVSERVNEVNSNKQKAIDEAVAKAKAEWDEAQKIASLTGQEKLEAEFNAKLKEAKKDRDSLNSELRKVQTELAISKAQAQLAGLDLPTEFAVNLLGKDDAETTQNIQAFDAKVKELVTKKVNESIARVTPKVGGDVRPTDEMQSQIAKVMGIKT